MLAALHLIVALAQEPTFHVEGMTLIPPAAVTFAAGAQAPEAGAEPVLDHVRAWLAAKTYVTTLRIEAHVSGAPDAQRLSEQRALAVARWLVAHGVACGRLLPVGFGDTKPVAAGDTPESRAANTRIVFTGAALRGTLVGGMPADGGGKVAGDPCAAP